MRLGRGQVFADRFEILGVAGAGGMGTVYRASDRLAGGQVALKVVPPSESRRVERWSREARALAELSHPGLPRYIAHGLAPAGERWIAMEWLEGEDLAQRLAYGRLSVGESVTLARRAAEALAVAHAAGIVHRDIKPSNLFLPGGKVERVKLLDFGVARWQRGGRDQTRTGVRVGTPRYMAPEQARGARDLDGRVDIFALGCVLFYCLTGRHAFTGDDEMAVLAKILLDEAPRPSDVTAELPPEIDRLVARMLAKDPRERPRDCQELIEELALLSMADGTGASGDGGAGLGAAEQRLLSVVVVGGGLGTGETTPGSGPRELEPRLSPDDTQPFLRPQGPREAVEAMVAEHGGRMEPLADGSIIATVTSVGAATDQAIHAARLAFALRGMFPQAAMAVATGRAVVARESPVGEVIDRVARLVRREESRPAGAGAPRPIRVCDVTARLLEGRFEIAADEDGQLIAPGRGRGEEVRRLLGQSTPLVGRDLEMGMLRGVWSECVSEPVARAVVITAEPGVGKSRLRHELARWLSRQDEPSEGCEIWECEGDHLRAGSPFGMLAPALRRTAGIHEGEPLAARRGKLRARVALHVPPEDVARVSEFLGEIAGVPFGGEDSVQLRAAREDPILMGDQLRRAFEDLVRAEAAAHPLLLVLDDLHWGDLPTVRLCDAALRAAHDLPFMILALGRPEIDNVFARLWEGRRVTRLELGELSRKACERLIERTLGSGTAPGLVARLIERAAGNAFFLEELIRAAGAGAAGAELPATVLAMLQARLEEQPAEARRILRAASIYGAVFSRGGLLALLGADVDPGVLDGWLEHLAQHEIVARHHDRARRGEATLSFRHALVREAAYATLTEPDRVLGHRLAAAWLRQAGETDAMVLAEHLRLGGEPAEAAGSFLAAALSALDADDLAGAIERAERGVVCGATGETLGRLRLVQAEASSWRGELAPAERHAEAALRELPPASAAWHAAAAELAAVVGRTGHLDRAEEVARRLLEEGRGGARSRTLVLAAARSGVSLLFAGRYELGNALVEMAGRLGAELLETDPPVAAAVYRARAIRALSLGDQAAGLVHYPAAIEACERAGDLRGALQARGNLANRYKVLGGHAQAERLLGEVLDAAERLGLSTVGSTAKHNLGLVLANQGRLEAALAVERAAAEELRAQGDRRLEGGAHAYLARILGMAGRHDEALVEAEAAAERTDASRPMHAAALAALAEARLAVGDLAGALAAGGEAQHILEELGGLDEGDAAVRLAYIRVLRAAGRDEDARAAAAVARERLQAAAAKITDEEWRKSFLENVPENRATLAL